MQPREGVSLQGRGGRPPVDQDLEEHLRLTTISGQWQPGVAFPRQFGPGYALPYGVAPAYQPQMQAGFAQNALAGSARQYNQSGGVQYPQRPDFGSRPSSASVQRPPSQGPSAGVRPSAPQFAAFYPQFAAGYPMQYMAAAPQWHPMPGQQPGLAPFLPQPPGARAPFLSQGALPFLSPRQPGSQGGRQQQTGRFQRQYEPNRGRGQGQYRDMWQQVTQVCLRKT